MKNWYFLLLVFAAVIVISGCINSEPAPDKSASEASGELKEFAMSARQWEFEPNIVTVNSGDQVKLVITSEDVKHGIAIPEFGVSADLNPGETTTVEFTAGSPGTYFFFCNVFCGSGHGEMTGQIVVK